MPSIALANPGYETAVEAQEAINLHPISLQGRCLSCEVEGPCGSRYLAEMALSNTMQLPRRVPGATRPEILSLARTPSSGFRWLGPTGD